MRKQSVVLVFVVCSACAGLLWASQSLADLVHRPSAPASIPADAKSSARAARREAIAARPLFAQRAAMSRDSLAEGAGALPPGWAGTAIPAMAPALANEPSYATAVPEYMQDPVTIMAHSIAVGDVSGDGRDDVVFIARNAATNPADLRTEIFICYQLDTGRLAPAVKIGDSGRNLSYQLEVVDLDGDGVDDIITTSVDSVIVLRSNADGTFTRSTALAGDPYEIVVTDVDRDGHLDVLVDSSDTLATVVHGDGRGGIDHVSTVPLPSSAVRTVGDVTGDGLDDVVLATIVGRPLEEFQVYAALPGGGYAAPVVMSLPVGSNQASSLAVGDFNGDGRGDLALDEAKDGASLRLYFQDAQGKLVFGRTLGRNRGAGDLMTVDLDRDGRSDLVMAHSGWGYIGYYLQKSTGLSQENVVEAYQFHGRVNYFAAGDLNHDGCGDLIVARVGQSPVIIYGQGCGRGPIANCSLPAVQMASSPVAAAAAASPLVPQRVGIGRPPLRQRMPRVNR